MGLYHLQIDTQKKNKVIIPIAVRQGSGKVSFIDAKPNSFDFNLFNVAAAEAGSEVEVVVFQDRNGNGKMDRTEKLLPWAGVSVSLEDSSGGSNDNTSGRNQQPANSGPVFVPLNSEDDEPVPFYKIHVPQ